MILTEEVGQYLLGLRAQPDPVLAEMEAHGQRDGIPIVVPETGALLHVLALIRGATRAVEVGTAIGVSTLHIARGLAPGGTIVSFEIDAQRHRAAGEYLARAGVADRAQLRLQDAREGLAELDGEFDFAFMDGVKNEYDDYLGLLLPRLALGGVLVVDNVLWGGEVARPDSSERASMMHEFNRRALSHPELDGTIVAVGDGVLIAVKRGQDGGR